MWILNKQTNCKFDIDEKDADLVKRIKSNTDIYEELQEVVETKKKK